MFGGVPECVLFSLWNFRRRSSSIITRTICSKSKNHIPNFKWDSIGYSHKIGKGKREIICLVHMLVKLL